MTHHFMRALALFSIILALFSVIYHLAGRWDNFAIRRNFSNFFSLPLTEDIRREQIKPI